MGVEGMVNRGFRPDDGGCGGRVLAVRWGHGDAGTSQHHAAPRRALDRSGPGRRVDDLGAAHAHAPPRHLPVVRPWKTVRVVAGPPSFFFLSSSFFFFSFFSFFFFLFVFLFLFVVFPLLFFSPFFLRGVPVFRGPQR